MEESHAIYLYFKYNAYVLRTLDISDFERMESPGLESILSRLLEVELVISADRKELISSITLFLYADMFSRASI